MDIAELCCNWLKYEGTGNMSNFSGRPIVDFRIWISYLNLVSVKKPLLVIDE